MTIFVKIMPNPLGPLVVGLVYDGLCTFEFGIVAEIFGMTRPEMGPGWYRFASHAIEPGPLRADGGITIEAPRRPHLLRKADLIVVPGWKGIDVPIPDDLVAQLRAAHARGARLASICSGAFVLAATGLLDGATATTHWRYADALRKRYPAIGVDEASLYRAADRIYTSAGSAAGIDLLIEIVRQDFGPAAANAVARRIVMPAHRTGGQSQFLERPVPERGGNQIAPLLDLIRGSLDQAWTIQRMSRQCRMSDRTFLRRFAEATAVSPGEWITVERVEAAKDLLCQVGLRLDEVARAAGFGTADTLRHHFRRRVGISPAEYRVRFAR